MTKKHQGVVSIAWIAGLLLGLTYLQAFAVAQGASAPTKAPNGMVWVPGGTFSMGSANGNEDERPVHKMEVQAFFLDQTGVTTAAYATYLTQLKADPSKQHAYQAALPKPGYDRLCNYDKKNGQATAGKENHPINCVNYAQAQAYCQAIGKRLPTEVEREYVAKGPGGSEYPWGNEPPSDQNTCFSGDKIDRALQGTCPVGSYPKTLLGKKNEAGVADLAGNVYEWVNAEYLDAKGKLVKYPTHKACDTEHSGESGRCGLRGGSWRDRPMRLRSSFRYDEYNPEFYFFVGFRCARTP